MAWLVYGLLVSTLLGAAAWLLERAARWQGWQGRWAWGAALVGSAGLPLWAWLAPSSEPAVAAGARPLPGAYVMEALPPLVLESTTTAGPSVSGLVVLAWAAASALLLLWLAIAALRLRAAERGWVAEDLDGVRVLVSESTGPAAMGLIRGRVVLPRWALGLDERQRRLMVLHEAEHVRAGDPQLAVAGLVLCALMPWNVAAWWQLRRLRLAMEMDCDARVLRRAGDVRSYGALLLEVGQRRGARLAVGLAENRTSLERRIRMMTRTTTGRRTLRALGLAAISGVVLAVACETPGPMEVSDPEPKEVTLEDVESATVEGGFWAMCSSDGNDGRPLYYVNGLRVDAQSHRDLELEPEEIATIEIVKRPRAAGEATGSCGVISILTKDATDEERMRVRRLMTELQAQATPQKSENELAAEPTFTPMTARPTLENTEEVQRALLDQYPPMLRDAGIEGTTNVWFFIDAAGTVQKVQVNRSSGHDGLDEAALKVASGMEFEPAYNRDRPVPVWVALDITFSLQNGAAPDSRRPARQELTAEQERERRVLAERLLEEARERATPPASATSEEIAAQPTFTPMTVRPKLRNPEEIRALLNAEYPPVLRDAGIGGTTNVWFFIGSDGTVQKTQVNKTSGHEPFDQAALRVASGMKFTPAYNQDQPVPVWVALDITFEQ